MTDLPKAQNGLTLPLSKFFASQDLAKHRAMVALELEVMAKKMDRFGWERDRNSLVHDRLVTDWMDALQDFTLDEIRAACRQAVKARPNSMPNEGHILEQITKARTDFLRMNRPPVPPEPERKRVDPETHAAILASVGFKPQRFGGDA